MARNLYISVLQVLHACRGGLGRVWRLTGQISLYTLTKYFTLSHRLLAYCVYDRVAPDSAGFVFNSLIITLLKANSIIRNYFDCRISGLWPRTSGRKRDITKGQLSGPTLVSISEAFGLMSSYINFHSLQFRNHYTYKWCRKMAINAKLNKIHSSPGLKITMVILKNSQGCPHNFGLQDQDPGSK